MLSVHQWQTETVRLAAITVAAAAALTLVAATVVVDHRQFVHDIHLLPFFKLKFVYISKKKNRLRKRVEENLGGFFFGRELDH